MNASRLHDLAVLHSRWFIEKLATMPMNPLTDTGLEDAIKTEARHIWSEWEQSDSITTTGKTEED